MCRCKGIRYQKSLWEFDLWSHGAVLLITVPSVGKSSRLLAYLPTFVHLFHHHSQQAGRWAYLNAASISQTEPEIILLCFRLSRTAAKLPLVSWVWKVTYGFSGYSFVEQPSVGFLCVLASLTKLLQYKKVYFFSTTNDWGDLFDEWVKSL